MLRKMADNGRRPKANREIPANRRCRHHSPSAGRADLFPERVDTMIKFRCEKCGHVVPVKDELAGKNAFCPKCHAVCQIPASTNEFYTVPRTEGKEPPGPHPARVPYAGSDPSLPLGSDKERIKYDCPVCKGKLENPGTMGGRQDKCPLCGSVHPVPLSKGQQKEIDRRKAVEADAAILQQQREDEEKARIERQEEARLSTPAANIPSLKPPVPLSSKRPASKGDRILERLEELASYLKPPSKINIPQYDGIESLAMTCRVVGAFLGVSGVIMLVVGLFSLDKRSDRGFAENIAFATVFGTGVFFVLLAFLSWWCASLFVAFKDLVQNSWHVRQPSIITEQDNRLARITEIRKEIAASLFTDKRDYHKIEHLRNKLARLEDGGEEPLE